MTPDFETLSAVNGVLGAALPAHDRGALYGDGVFRTLVVRERRPVCWGRHYARLAEDCSRLALPCPPAADLLADLAALSRDRPDGVVRITVTRGTGGRGYKIPSSLTPNRVVSLSPPPLATEVGGQGVTLRLCRLRLAHQPRLAGVKHLNRLENVLARAEWDDPAVSEGLLLDTEDRVIEGVMSNVFLRRGTTLVTPELSRCGVAGVTRDRVLEAAPALGLQAEVRAVTLAELRDADEVLLTNSVIGVWQVTRFQDPGQVPDQDRHWAPGALTHRLRAWLHETTD